MEEQVNRNGGQGIGIAALVTAIVTFILAVIPCIGIIAIIPGIVAVILGVVGLSQASRNDSPRGLIIAGLVIGVIATLIAFSQIFLAGRFADRDNWNGDFRNIIKDVRENVINEMDDGDVNIKIESDGKVIEINAKKGEKVRVLEQLEGADSLSKDEPDSLRNDTTKVGK